MAQLIAGIATLLVVLIAVSITIGLARAWMNELRGEIQKTAKSLQADIARFDSEYRSQLTRLRSETRAEREQREAEEEHRRDEARRQELDQVAAECSSLAGEFVRLGATYGVQLRIPTKPLAAVSEVPTWWAVWIKDNQSGLDTLWPGVAQSTGWNREREVGTLSTCLQAVLRAFPDAIAGTDDAKPVIAMLNGVACQGPDEMLGVVLTRPRLVSPQALQLARDRLRKIEASREVEAPYSSYEPYESDPSGYCCPCNSTPG